MSATILSGLIILTVPFLRRDHFLQWGVQQANGPTRFPYCKIPYASQIFNTASWTCSRIMFYKGYEIPFRQGVRSCHYSTWCTKDCFFGVLWGLGQPVKLECLLGPSEKTSCTHLRSVARGWSTESFTTVSLILRTITAPMNTVQKS